MCIPPAAVLIFFQQVFLKVCQIACMTSELLQDRQHVSSLRRLPTGPENFQEPAAARGLQATITKE